MNQHILKTWVVPALAAAGLLLTASSISAGADSLGVNVKSGDRNNGKEIYNKVCIACHGDRAQGNELLNAPRLAGQEPWYLARQLKYFVTGVRGADPKDIYGMQMRPMALTLKGDQDIADIVAFITSLETRTASTAP